MDDIDLHRLDPPQGVNSLGTNAACGGGGTRPCEGRRRKGKLMTYDERRSHKDEAMFTDSV